MPTSDVKVDTLVVRDTIRVSEAKYIHRRVVDSVFVPAIDTMTIHDTLVVLLEREQLTWEDSLCRVYASGINPQVDSVMHFTSDRIITKELTRIVKKNTKWGLGVTAGYGVSSDGLAPFVGLGVSYNILAW